MKVGVFRKKTNVLVGVFSVFAVFVMVLAGIPIIASVTPIVAVAMQNSNVHAAAANVTDTIKKLTIGHPDGLGALDQFSLTQGLDCVLAFGTGISILGISAFGPGCLNAQSGATGSVYASAVVAAKNIMITHYNYLNITNAEVANLNATFQELLSYYENRAEAIVPYFLNGTWNNSVYDQIAIDSGLIPSIEGLETAIGHQQFQDWNATVNSWAAAFGNGGTYDGTTACFAVLAPTDCLASNGANLEVTQPFETWSVVSAGGTGQNNTYFNLAPGGTVFTADIANLTDGYGNYTVYDETQGFHFFVPQVNYTDYAHDTIPIETTLHNINQFDLLKIVCNFNCTNGDTHDLYETSGGFVFQNVTKALDGLNLANGAYETLNLIYPAAGYSNLYAVPAAVGSFTPGSCINFSPHSTPTCQGPTVPTGGNSTTLGGGPGAAVAGDATLYSYGPTMQNIVNNTMVMAYDYWQTLRVITLNGTFSIPPNCAIPTPSEAFPAATNFQDYQLSPDDIESVYLSYLNAVAREYDEVFTNQVGFCGDPNLGFAFNWTGSWTLALNISASVYLANATGPINLNGTQATGTTYNNVASWPVYRIDPTLLYPYEYQQNIPLNEKFPIPVNNPMIAVLVNDPQNLEYGNPVFSPEWGIPTYVSLTGNGNYTNVSGNSTSIPSGSPITKGDAVVINSCVLNGINESPCDISVTYFNAFSIGFVHAIIPPPFPFPPICGPFCEQAQTVCGTGALNQWYDAWAGTIVTAGASVFIYIGSATSHIPDIGGYLNTFFTDVGCIVGWIILILVLIGVVILSLYIVRIVRG